ncbi:MAG: LysE family translocator [Microscillaceae bacterium]|nr:LysE family translocator [Microscillaceae bacterium]MDW8461233.1 LysE family translocator [Cytophagales bacterium]
MVSFVLEAIGCGVGLAFLIGPTFFALVKVSIEKGFRSGVLLALGVALSDFTTIVLVYLGLSELSNSATFRLWIGLIGGVVLIIMGIISFFNTIKKKKLVNTRFINSGRGVWYIFSGFILNALNPSVYLFWAGIVTLVILPKNYANTQAFTFFGIALGIVFLTDTLKAYIANKISGYLNRHTLSLVDKATGTILLGFGAYMIWYTITHVVWYV